MRPTPALLRDASERLAAAGVENPRLDSRLLLAQALDMPRGAHLGDVIVTDAGREAFDRLLARRAGREPLAYIAGVKEFWSLDFAVGPGVLVPRPESETLIDEALKEFSDRRAGLRILDLGTGSGCLLMAALSEYPHAAGVGIESSDAAFAWAERNRARHGLERRCELRLANWSAAEGRFDMILSNPPYVSHSELGSLAPELEFEPLAALDGGADGLAAYRTLGSLVPRLLAEDGRAFVEIGAGQGVGASAPFAAEGLECLRIAPDIAGIERVLVLGRPKKPLESPDQFR